MTSRRQYKADAVVAAVLAATSLGFWLHLVVNPVGMPVFGVASGTLPTVLALLLFVMSFGLALMSAMRALRAPEVRSEANGEQGEGWYGAARLVGLLALCIAFTGGLRTFGFLLCGGALVLGTALLFGNRRLVTIGLIVVLAPLALSQFFERFMVIYLPAGRLFQ